MKTKKDVLKKVKKGGGSATFDGPKSKKREKFAPATKVETPEKGKGSYNRKKDVAELEENSDIVNFIECLLLKKYASANKYLNNAVETKIQEKISSELETPLF